MIRQQEGLRLFESVDKLISSYGRAWESLHPPYALLEHPVTGEALSALLAEPMTPGQLW